MKQLGKTSITVTLKAADDDQTKHVTEFIQSQLQQNLPNLKIQVNNIPFATLLDQTESGNFQMSMMGLSADFADPISFLAQMTSDSSENNGKWSNKTFDDAIDRSNNADANNPTKRWQDLVTAEKTLSSDQGLTSLYQSNGIDLVNPKLKGVIYDRINGHYDYREAYLTK